MQAYLILIVLGIFCALFSDKINKVVKVDVKLRIALEIFLVGLAVIIAIGNFFSGRSITYFASIVSVCGTLVFLVVDILPHQKESVRMKT